MKGQADGNVRSSPNRNRLLIMDRRSNNTRTSPQHIWDESTVFRFRVDSTLYT